MRKGAENGRFIVDTLKDRLTKDLRQAVKEWSKKPYVQIKGKKLKYRKDVINPEIIKKFQMNIRNTFETYTKKDSKYGVPSNIHNIAVTEVRSNIDEIKYKYTERLLQRNDDLEAWKRWKHNRRLSKKYRFGHMMADGQTVKINEEFAINTYKEVKGFLYPTGVVRCRYPHDPRLPLKEIVGCNCEYEIIIKIKR